MDKTIAYLNQLVLDPRYKDILMLIKSARNGAVYGAKVRFPHALVMIFLFRSGTFRSKIITILKATRTHAKNLASFAFIYKAIMLFLQNSPRPLAGGAKEANYDTFLAGLVGGYMVFGRGIQSSVNQQIVIYVFARVVLGLAKINLQQTTLISPKGKEKVSAMAWPAFAALSWGTVMWLFRWHAQALQPSLRSSMVYIYEDSNRWTEFRNFLIHNK